MQSHLMNRRAFVLGSVAAVPLLASRSFALEVPEGAPPALRDADGYLKNVETAIFEGPRREVIATLQTPETGVLAFAKPTPAIPGIASLEAVQGAFPQMGAVRRVHLSNGHSVIERVLRNDQDVFSYQIWGSTAPNTKAVNHIRGTFEYVALADNKTEVTWTYEIAPRVFLARPFVRRFLRNDFGPFMSSGLTGAAEAFNAKRRS